MGGLRSESYGYGITVVGEGDFYSLTGGLCLGDSRGENERNYFKLRELRLTGLIFAEV